MAKRPDYPINVSLLLFSTRTAVIMPMQRYNRDSVRAAVRRLPRPEGGTAIGDAMDAARIALYKAGTFRKVMLVVTDGNNTNGRDPGEVAREIHRRRGQLPGPTSLRLVVVGGAHVTLLARSNSASHRAVDADEFGRRLASARPQ